MVRRCFRDQLTQLSPVHMDIVFFRLDEFIDLHSRIVEGLKASKNDVGKVLMQYFADFSHYREYCVRLGKVQAILAQEELRLVSTRCSFMYRSVPLCTLQFAVDFY